MELILLGVVAVLLFGPAKIPEMARSLGRAHARVQGLGRPAPGSSEALDGRQRRAHDRHAVEPGQGGDARAGEGDGGGRHRDEGDLHRPARSEEGAEGRGEAADDDAAGARPQPLPAAREMPVVAAPLPGRAARARGARRSSDLRRFLSRGSGSSVGTSGLVRRPPTEDRTARACRRRRARRCDRRRRRRHAAPRPRTKRVNGKAALETRWRSARTGPATSPRGSARRRPPRARRRSTRASPRPGSSRQADLPRDGHDLVVGGDLGRARRLQHEVDRARAGGDVRRLRQRARRPTTPGTSSSPTRRSRQEPEDQPGRHDHGLGRRQRHRGAVLAQEPHAATRSSRSASPSRAPT